MTHPFFDAGAFESREPDARFVVEGSYCWKAPLRGGTFERDGLTITFYNWCYPLSDYARTLEDAGFLIARPREPTFCAEGPRHDRMPLFLHMRAVRPT